jgi:hypothetical protein
LDDDKQDSLEEQETPSKKSVDLFETIVVSMEVEDSCETMSSLLILEQANML